eukprot:1144950-Pelagomonas_calceolata.AAC.2
MSCYGALVKCEDSYSKEEVPGLNSYGLVEKKMPFIGGMLGMVAGMGGDLDWLSPLQSNWFRAVMRLYNSMTMQQLHNGKDFAG